MTLYTVGYEGLDIDEFIAGLKKNRIKLIIDIRRTPVSRKKGFSKNKLRDELAPHGIDYLYFGKELGVPAEWRKKAKEDIITRKKMFSMYVKQILPKQDLAIRDVIEAAKKKPAALLCYEADEGDCHRHYLADEIQSRLKTKIVNIEIPSSKLFSLRASGFKPHNHAV